MLYNTRQTKHLNTLKTYIIVMNNRLKALAVAFLILITITTFVNAVEVNPIAQELETNNTQLTALRQEVNTKFALVDKKLDNLITKDQVTSLLTAHLQKTNEIMDWFRSLLIVSFIVIGLAFLGFGYSIFFYLKSLGRL